MPVPRRESVAESATLDEIVQRAKRARRRRNRFWRAPVGVFLLLAFAATASAVYLRHEIRTNEAFLNATLKRATTIVDGAVALAERCNVPRTATLAVLARADGLFVDMALYGQPTLELRYRVAQMLIRFARNYGILGDTNEQLARETEAYGLLAGLAAEKPDDTTYQRDLAVLHYRIGRVLEAQDKLDAALASYRTGLAIYERLAAIEPNNARWQRGSAIGYGNGASVYRAMGKLAEALAELRKGRQIIAATVEMAPGDAYSKEGLVWFNEQIAALERQMQSARQ